MALAVGVRVPPLAPKEITMGERLKKCKHGMYVESCAFCKGLVTKKNQTKAYVPARDADFRDLENEDDRDEQTVVEDLSEVFGEEIDERILPLDLNESPNTGPSNDSDT